jgi:hypothetical protein
MTTLTCFTIETIEQISQPSPPTAKQSELNRLAKVCDDLADEVERHWDRVSPELRDLLKAFAYSGFEKQSGWRVKFTQIPSVFYALILVYQGGTEALGAYFSAAARLKRAVLSALERDSEAYKKDVAEAVSDAFEKRSTTSPMTPEQFRGWLTDLPD